jgi:hypothetical protein
MGNLLLPWLFGRGFSGTTLEIRSGSTEIVSYCPKDMGRCCCTACCICGDGDLMEGISHEAASLEGHLHLGKLSYLYDRNHISLAGATEIDFKEDVAERSKRMACTRMSLTATTPDAAPGCLQRYL